MQEKYLWYRCDADPAQYGPGRYYYIHHATMQTQWEEPNEPFWVWDAEKQCADEKAGLQQPKAATPAKLEEPPAGYVGYNPKIHGNYDPNADYAQYHKQLRAEEQGVDPTAVLAAQNAGTTDYGSTMALNRFTGNAQASHLSADRHTDAAKSSRQLNNFFDVDAAANAHNGRSLKEERKSKKLTKEEVKAYNEARKEKKQKKRMQFYKS